MIELNDLVSGKHPAFTLSADISQISQPLIEKYGINYFQFIKVNKNGSIALLCNHMEYIQQATKHCIKKNMPFVYSHIPQKEYLNKHNYYFLWEPNLPQEPVLFAREHNISRGLCFVERHVDCYYLIAFAVPVSHPCPIDCYFTHLQELQHFIQKFKIEHKSFIHTLEQYSIQLPKNKRDVNTKKLILQPGYKKRQIPIIYNNRQSYITWQEKQCLYQLSNGKTIKNIGKTLHLSPRTVESYLSRIKNRIGCQTKMELLELAQQL